MGVCLVCSRISTEAGVAGCRGSGGESQGREGSEDRLAQALDVFGLNFKVGALGGSEERTRRAPLALC